ncbi:MAG: methyltransferase domain-containing protein [Firmicutes bacterium]|nr:methyltransferase domain-containing protein [Bacillota bacterium]
MFRCPKCREKLTLVNRSYICPSKHSYDLAKSGYVNLSLKQKKQKGDNKLMVDARTQFLEKDYYDFMRQFVKQKIQEYNIQTLVDAGCGQGYYTKAFAQIVEKSYAFDLSKEAIHYASKQDKKTQYFVASLFDMPFFDETIDGMTTIFTPIAREEMHRVLKTSGYLIVVGPGENHLVELKEQMYEKVRYNDTPSELLEGFEMVSRDKIAEVKKVKDVWALLEMTPYRYNSPRAGLEKVQSLEELDVTFEFYVTIWRKK